MESHRQMDAWIKKKGVYGLVKTKLPIPEIKPDEVLIHVKAAGICGTDIGIYNGKRDVPDGLVPGHEFCGEVMQVGEMVKGIQVGDFVTPGIIINCGICSACHRGFEAQCDNLLEYGIHINGAFAEYVAAKATTIHKLPKEISPVVGASIEPVAVAYNIAKKVDGICLNKNVMVFGPGPIGLYTIQLLKSMGFKNVIMVGTRESRLKIAREMGAVTINIREEDVLDGCKRIIGEKKADVIIEATGNTDVFDYILKLLSPHGKLILAGIFHENANVNLFPLVRNETNIVGAFCYTWDDYQNALELVVDGKIRFDGIVTHTLPMSQADKGFELAIDRKAIKVILENE